MAKGEDANAAAAAAAAVGPSVRPSVRPSGPSASVRVRRVFL